MLSYIAPDDYTTLMRTITLDSATTSVHLIVNITDDMLCEPDERFEIMLTSRNDNCAVTTSPVPVYIVDNDGELLANNNNSKLCISDCTRVLLVWCMYRI